MAESYSVKARLSATDSGFTSTLKRALGSVTSLADKIKGGFAFGVLAGAGQQAFSAIKSGISSMVSEMGTANAAWKTFDANLKILGKTESEIKSVKSSMQKYATQTIYSASDMASTYAQLAAVGIKNTDKLVTGFGGLAAAAENPTQAMKTLSTQAVQMAAKPKVAWQDFKLMLEQTPAGLSAVAKEMGMTTSELVTAVQDGKVKTEDFFKAIDKVGNSKAFSNMATQYKTVNEAMDGLTETVSNVLNPAFDVLSQAGIDAISGIIDKLGEIDGKAIAEKVSGWIKKAQPYWEAFKTAVSKVWGVVSGVAKKLAPMFSAVGSAVRGSVKSFLDSVGQIDVQGVVAKISTAIDKIKGFFQAIADTGAFKALKTALSDLKNAFGNIGGAFGDMFKGADGAGVFDKIATSIGNVIKLLAKAISYVSKFVSGLSSGQMTGILGAIAGVAGGFKALDFLKSFKPFSKFKKNTKSDMGGAASSVVAPMSKIAQIINSVGGVIKSLGTGIKSIFVGFGKAMKVANPVNILALGVAIGIVAASFALLATQSSGVAEIITSIGTALGAIVSAAIQAVADALLTMAPIIPIIAEALVTMTPVVTAFGEAFAMVATAIGNAITQIVEALPPLVTAIGEAVSMIVEAFTPVVEIISTAITNIVQIISDAVVQIIEAIAPFLPAITDMITQIVQIVSDAIVKIVEALAPYMPELTKMVEATAQAIEAICAAFTALVEQIAPIVQAVTELVSTLGTAIADILGGVGDVLTSFGEAFNSAVTGIGDAIASVVDAISGGFAKVLDSIAGIINSIGNSARNAGEGFKATAEGIQMIAAISILDIAKSLGAVAVGMGEMVSAGGGLPPVGEAMEKITGSMLMSALAVASVNQALQGMSGTALSMVGSFTAAGTAIALFATKTGASSANIQQIGASAATAAGGFKPFASAALTVAASVLTLGKNAKSTVAGILSMAMAVKVVESGMTGIARGAAKTVAALQGMVAASQSVGAGLDALRTTAMTAMDTIGRAFDKAANAAKKSGTDMGNGFALGLQRSLVAAQVMVTAMVTTLVSALKSGRNAAYNAGSYFSAGFAQGMRSQLSAIKSAADQMAAAADKAVRAKLRIHSPSKVAEETAGYYGIGFVNTFDSMKRKVWAAAERMVSIPDIALPDLAMAYSGEMDADYDYYRNAEYTIEVSMPIDGREFARTTATYTQDELDRQQTRRSRRHGKA